MYELVRKTLQLTIFKLPLDILYSDGKKLNSLCRLYLGLRLHRHQIAKSVVVMSHDISDVPARPAANDQRQHDAGKHG